MGNFCTKCGTPFSGNVRFCTKCGAQNPDFQNSQVGDSVQVPPTVQVPPQPQVQQAPPQPQYMYNNPPVQQAQPVQTVYMQSAPQAAPAPKDSGVGRRVACIILGVILAAEVCFALFVYPKFINLNSFRKPLVAMQNIPKDPKDRYLFYMENTLPKLEEKFSDLGTKHFDLFFGMGENESDKSHQSQTKTEFSLINSDGDETNATFTQYSAYNKDNGDSMLGLEYGYGDYVGTCGAYFTGNELICQKTDNSMLRYYLPDEQKEGIKNMCAADQFAMVMMGKNSEDEIDWEAQVKELENGVFADCDDDDFEIRDEVIDILDGNCKCEVVSVTRNGVDGIRLLNAMVDNIEKIVNYAPVTESLDTMIDENQMSEEDKNNTSVTVDVIAYRNVPVGIRFKILIGEKELYANIYGYYDGYEEHTELSAMVPNSTLDEFSDEYYSSDESMSLSYVDKVFKNAGDNYKYVTTIDYDSYSMNMELNGTINEKTRKMSGKFKIVAEMDSSSKWNVEGNISIKEDTSSGGKTSTNVVDYTVKPSGMEQYSDDPSDVDQQTMTGKIKTETNTKYGKPSIDAPVFLEGSGIDVGSNRDLLVENLRSNSDMFVSKNSFARTMLVYFSLF